MFLPPVPKIVGNSESNEETIRNSFKPVKIHVRNESFMRSAKLMFMTYTFDIITTLIIRDTQERSLCDIVSLVMINLILLATVSLTHHYHITHLVYALVISSSLFVVILPTYMDTMFELNYSIILQIYICILIYNIDILIILLLSVLLIIYFTFSVNLRFKHLEVQRVIFAYSYETNSKKVNYHELQIYLFISQLSLFIFFVLIGIYLRLNQNKLKQYTYEKLVKVCNHQNIIDSLQNCNKIWLKSFVPINLVEDVYDFYLINVPSINNYFHREIANVSLLTLTLKNLELVVKSFKAKRALEMITFLHNEIESIATKCFSESYGTFSNIYNFYIQDSIGKNSDLSILMCGYLLEIIIGYNKRYYSHTTGKSLHGHIGLHYGKINFLITGGKHIKNSAFSHDVLIVNYLSNYPGKSEINLSQDFAKTVSLEVVYINAGSISPEFLIQHHIKRSANLKVFNIKNLDEIMTENIALIDELPKNSKGLQNLLYLKHSSIISDNSSDDFSFHEFARPKHVVLSHEKLKHQIELFNNPPLNRFTLKFDDPNVEDLVNQTSNVKNDFEIIKDEIVVITITDLSITFTFTTFLFVNLLVFEGTNIDKRMIPIIVLYVVNFLIYQLFLASFALSLNFNKPMMPILYHVECRTTALTLFSFIPIIMIMILMYTRTKYTLTNDLIYHTYLIFAFASLLINCGTHSFIRIILGVIFLIINIYFLTVDAIDITKKNYIHKKLNYNCTHRLPYDSAIRILTIPQLITIILLFIKITRSNERMLRLYFLNKTVFTDMSIEQQVSEENLFLLVGNIIPLYMINKIGGIYNIKDANFPTTFSAHEVSVMYLEFTNFLAFYRETNTLRDDDCLKYFRILNAVLIEIDTLLLKYERYGIEKFMNATTELLIPCGFNSQKQKSLRIYAYILSQLTFDIEKALLKYKFINQFGQSDIRLKGCISVGKVHLGVVGRAKPVLWMWGPVMLENVFICKNINDDVLLVTQQVAKLLNEEYEFSFHSHVKLKNTTISTYLFDKRANTNKN